MRERCLREARGIDHYDVAMIIDARRVVTDARARDVNEFIEA